MKNICDWNNCTEVGEYKAPVEKDNSKKYRLLCFKHIKDFTYSEKDLKAFEILGIPASNSWHKIREKFKKLVKKFHPDMNSGDKNFEEKLKVITLAYTQLKRTLKK